MRAVTQLRNTKKVSRLIYISCSPASAVKNFVDLSRPSSKTLRGAPFVPVQAVPVDMFPYTKHVELAVLFEREVIYFISCNIYAKNCFTLHQLCVIGGFIKIGQAVSELVSHTGRRINKI